MKKWILDHLPTIWVCAIYAFGMIMIIDHAKADWIMKKPITYKEESKVNSAPVSDVYINEISKKVEDKLKLIEENEKKGILKSTTLDRFERDGQWCFIKIVIRQKGDDIIKEEIMECADTEHGRTDKEKIAELEKQIELEKAKKPGYWELFDPTNGYLAIRKTILKKINIDKVDNKFFFEMLLYIVAILGNTRTYCYYNIFRLRFIF